MLVFDGIRKASEWTLLPHRFAHGDALEFALKAQRVEEVVAWHQFVDQGLELCLGGWRTDLVGEGRLESRYLGEWDARISLDASAHVGALAKADDLRLTFDTLA